MVSRAYAERRRASVLKALSLAARDARSGQAPKVIQKRISDALIALTRSTWGCGNDG